MTDTLDIYATPHQLLQLADLARCAHGPLSPLPAMQKNIADKTNKPLPGEWFADSAELKPEIIAFVRGLSSALSFTSLEFRTKKNTFSTSVYYAGTTVDSGISLTDTGDAVRIQAPPVMEAAVELIGRHTGESLFNRLGWDLELNIGEAQTLMAMVDGARRKTLNALLGSAPDLLISLKDIQESLKMKMAGQQWLAVIFADSLDLKLPSKEMALKSLKCLESKKLIFKKGKQWRLGKVAGALVSELLLLDSHINLRAVTTLENGGLGMTEIHVASGFANAHLLWSQDAATVKLVGLSSMELLAMLYDMIRPGLRELPDTTAPPGGKQAVKEEKLKAFCKQCGAALEPADKFCTRCGQQR